MLTIIAQAQQVCIVLLAECMVLLSQDPPLLKRFTSSFFAKGSKPKCLKVSKDASQSVKAYQQGLKPWV